MITSTNYPNWHDKMCTNEQGSIEAVRHALQVLPQDNVTLKFLLQAPGDVSTSDVDLAVAAEAVIFGFNVKATGPVKSYADKRNVEIRMYRVIYELVDEIRTAMEVLLEPVEVKKTKGKLFRLVYFEIYADPLAPSLHLVGTNAYRRSRCPGYFQQWQWACGRLHGHGRESDKGLWYSCCTKWQDNAHGQDRFFTTGERRSERGTNPGLWFFVLRCHKTYI